MNVEKLVEKQLLLCELKRRLEQEGRRPPPVKVEQIAYGPCLLLSRECGSGGIRIARTVGELLGWHVFDREIVEEIARLAHVREQLIESVEEHIRSRWRRRLSSKRPGEGFGPETYLKWLHEIVLTLGHHGDVVIVGRGAQYVLPSQCALRVRIVAPIELRIQRVMCHEHLTSEEARDYVRACDARRAAFIREVFQQDTNSPLNYDLVLNTADISPEAAVGTILAGLREKLGVRMDLESCAT